MTTEFTPNRNYPYPSFDDEPFIDVMREFALDVDRDMGALVIAGGIPVVVWDNNTAYAVDDRVLDATSMQIYQCLVAHTSGATTFLADRTASPTYWLAIGSTFVPRGEWGQATYYQPMDFVYATSENVAALCLLEHLSTSTGTIRDDSANWVFIIDLGLALSGEQQGQLILAQQIFGA